nr:MAG TPA: hypothetical protein [Caudoviricetes sp.]DAP34689.1 MAG TPA: hypothetical protein [Caudoviricetes sp.]
MQVTFCNGSRSTKTTKSCIYYNLAIYCLFVLSG